MPPQSDQASGSANEIVRAAEMLYALGERETAVAFDQAVHDVSLIARQLIDSLHSSAPPKDRAVEAEKARERSRIRFGERGTRPNSRSRS